MDYSSCPSNGCMLRFYLLAFQGVDSEIMQQVHKHCVPLTGPGSEDGSTTSTSTSSISSVETSTSSTASASSDYTDSNSASTTTGATEATTATPATMEATSGGRLQSSSTLPQYSETLLRQLSLRACSTPTLGRRYKTKFTYEQHRSPNECYVGQAQ
ncbi:unnamed protein product [Phytophthora lilii]|uniref:Unnamed protein product n=1 Tax=Phytophthora lilii TaxID=2077276 RepID=A0A9W6TFP0_9STRA|nr:unnamed protein product [Phytophthora lilii]